MLDAAATMPSRLFQMNLVIGVVSQLLVIRRSFRKELPSYLAHVCALPPSIEYVTPVIQPAFSEARK